MNKFLIILASGVVLSMAPTARSQELSDDRELNLIDKAISEQRTDTTAIRADGFSKEESLWKHAEATRSIENLSAYLNEFPDGKYSSEARSKIQTLKIVARVNADDKELDAYRKRRLVNGLILELDNTFEGVKPYVRSMLNSCGYRLVQPHRFAKRVYPTLVIGGQMFTREFDSEYSVKLDLSLVLKTNTREIKARQKMRSYRTSEIDAHRAIAAGFEDVGAQMKSGGFCLASR